MAKFGGCVLHHLASRLANVIREGWREGQINRGREGRREGGRETKNQFFKIRI